MPNLVPTGRRQPDTVYITCMYVIKANNYPHLCVQEKMKEEHKKEQEKMKEKHEKELQALKVNYVYLHNMYMSQSISLHCRLIKFQTENK